MAIWNLMNLVMDWRIFLRRGNVREGFGYSLPMICAIIKMPAWALNENTNFPALSSPSPVPSPFSLFSPIPPLPRSSFTPPPKWCMRGVAGRPSRHLGGGARSGGLPPRAGPRWVPEPEAVALEVSPGSLAPRLVPTTRRRGCPGCLRGDTAGRGDSGEREEAWRRRCLPGHSWSRICGEWCRVSVWR